MTFRFIDEHRQQWPVRLLCEALAVSPAGYYAWRERPVEIHMMGLPNDAKAIERVEKAGARRAIRWLPTGGRSIVEHALEPWEAAIREFTGG